MSTVLAIILFLFSVALLRMGMGALKDSSSHEAYGVEKESTHKTFSWFLILLGAGLGASAGMILAV